MMWVQLFQHTAKLTCFTFRKDRLKVPIWLISIILFSIMVALSFEGLYQTEQERQAMAETMKNPAMIAMSGPGYGLDNYLEGPMLAHQMLLFTGIAIAIMSILIVSRHTRSDEEEGRLELLRSFPIGRVSSISAIMVELGIANLLLTVLLGGGLASLSIDSIDLKGSFVYAAAIGSTGFLFAALTLVIAQLAANTRETISMSFFLVVFFYLIRAVGDVSDSFLSWLSPFGWLVKTEAFVQNYWGPIFITLGISVVFIGVAYYLNSVRDIDASFISEKRGKVEGSFLLKTPFGFVFKQLKTSLVAWVIGMFIFGIAYGSVFGDLESFFADNEMIQSLLISKEGLSLAEQFLGTLMSVIAMFATIAPLIFLLNCRGEEKKNRLEHLLSRFVSRNRILGSYLLYSLLFGSVILLVAGAGLWGSAWIVMDDPISLGTVLQSASVFLPAIWMMIGLTTIFIGWLPRFSSIIWLYLGYSFFVIYLGELLKLPDWLANLTPFGYIPLAPAEEIVMLPLIGLAFLAFIFIIFGGIGYRRRDIG